MKKARFLTILTILMLLTGAALAECDMTVYDVPEKGITVPMPSDYAVFRRDMPADDPSLALFGLNLDYVLRHLEEGELWLDALTHDLSREITLTIFREDQVLDLRLVTETFRNAYFDALVKNYEEHGVVTDRREVWTIGDEVYLLMWQRVGDQGDERIFCRTRRSLNSFTFLLLADGSVTEEDENLLRQILEGVQYRFVFEPLPIP